MAGTPFAEVFDVFMTLQNDYKLIGLYNSSESDFETYLEGWLIQAIEDFDICGQSLGHTGGSFSETLTQKNINILAYLMKKRWLEKEVDNVLQINLHLQDKDFKTYSEAQNMGAKQERLKQVKEELSQLLLDYEYKNNNWDDWFNGTFYEG